MIRYTDLKPGAVVIIDGQPYEILSAAFLRMQQRKAVVQTKFKNLLTGKIIERNIHQNETFEEADIEKRAVKYLYGHREEFWFSEISDPSKRFSLPEEVIGSAVNFIKANTEVNAVIFNGKIVSIKPPIKVDLVVKDTPPSDRGDTVSGGRKQATLETGAIVQVPLFINIGDTIRINTETGEYAERVEKK